MFIPEHGGGADQGPTWLVEIVVQGKSMAFYLGLGPHWILEALRSYFTVLPQVALKEITMTVLSYSTVVLYIGIMKVWGFWPKIISPKPA